MNKNIIAFSGFAVLGAVVGFIYGQGVRQNADSAVNTSFDGGVATVKLDTIKLAGGGLRAFLG